MVSLPLHRRWGKKVVGTPPRGGGSTESKKETGARLTRKFRKKTDKKEKEKGRGIFIEKPHPPNISFLLDVSGCFSEPDFFLFHFHPTKITTSIPPHTTLHIPHPTHFLPFFPHTPTKNLKGCCVIFGVLKYHVATRRIVSQET